MWDACGLAALERASLQKFVDFRGQASALVLPELLEAKAEFDFAYVDGSHLFEDVFVDAYFIVRLLGMGGVVAFDDRSNPHAATVLRFLRRSCQGGLQEIDLSPFRQGRSGPLNKLARKLGRVQLTAFRRVGDVERVWNSEFIAF